MKGGLYAAAPDGCTKGELHEAACEVLLMDAGLQQTVMRECLWAGLPNWDPM